MLDELRAFFFILSDLFFVELKYLLAWLLDFEFDDFVWFGSHVNVCNGDASPLQPFEPVCSSPLRSA